MNDSSGTDAFTTASPEHKGDEIFRNIRKKYFQLMYQLNEIRVHDIIFTLLRNVSA